MNKEDFKRLVDNPDLISGIYNYCDRWCERCLFTSRCANYSMGENQAGGTKSQDVSKPEFWDGLKEMFDVTLDMVKEAADEHGLDLDTIEDDSYSERRDRIDREARDHPCSRAAWTYMQSADAWFETNEDIFKAKQDDLNEQASMEIPELDPAAEAEEINDCIEMISWYKPQIYVKLMRAISGKLDERFEEWDDDYPRDSDGSAKVALIGIDRSIGAWSRLYTIFPSQENTILDALVALDRLRRQVEQTFPQARDFVRPGFDTGDSPLAPSAEKAGQTGG